MKALSVDLTLLTDQQLQERLVACALRMERAQALADAASSKPMRWVRNFDAELWRRAMRRAADEACRRRDATLQATARAAAAHLVAFPGFSS